MGWNEIRQKIRDSGKVNIKNNVGYFRDDEEEKLLCLSNKDSLLVLAHEFSFVD